MDDEIRFSLAEGDEIVLTRRDGMRYALSGFLTLVSAPPIPPIEPPIIPKSACLMRSSGVLRTSAGAFTGHSPSLVLDAGGNARYDFSGAVRTVRLDGLTWQGKRLLYRCDSQAHANANHKGACVFGGAFICPDMTPNLEWDPLYQSKSDPVAVVQIRECTIDGLLLEAPRIHGCFDGFQNGSGSRDTCQSVTLKKWAMSMVRDDAFENDNWWRDLLIDDCLIDGAFVLFSCRNSGMNGSGRENTIQRTRARLSPMNYKGKMTCGTFFKLNSNSVMINLEDNTFAADGTSHESGGQIFGQLEQFKKLGHSARNVFCWLGQGRNPHKLPLGFTGLEGAEALAAWDDGRRDFWASYPGHRFPGDPADKSAA